mgnify:FL=1
MKRSVSLDLKTPIVFASPLQSTDEVTADMETEGGDQPATTMHFVDENVGQSEEFLTLQDKSYLDAYKVDSALADFLSRPVLAATYTWTEGLSVDHGPHF